MQSLKNHIKFIYKIAAAFSMLFLPFQLLSQNQNGTPEMTMEIGMPPEPPQEPSVREEIYNPNGEYKVLENGKVQVLGHHKNKAKTGEFIYYDRNGSVTKKENYLNGLLHGECIEYEYGVPKYKREYFENRKINYEYEFGYNDTSFIAGPFVKEEINSGTFTIYSKNGNPIKNGELSSTITFDTIFFSSNKPIVIHHYNFTTKSGVQKPDFFLDIDLKKTKASYSPDFIEKLANSLRSYYPSYYPGQESRKLSYYNGSGTLVFKSDSGYTVSYFPNGRLKDSISVCSEGKVCRTGYNKNGELLYAVRMDKLSPQQTTNLYYGKNKKLIYEISTIKDKPDKVKIHSDSISKMNPKGILTDCFGTAYFYNPMTLSIDSSMTKLEYKFRKKVPLKDGRYFIIASEASKNKNYRVFEISGNFRNEYTVDSTLIYSGGKGSQIEIYQNDSIVYLVKESKSRKFEQGEEKYRVLKFLRKNGKLYIVHNRIINTATYSKEQLLASFEADTLPNLKSELLPEKEFKKALKMKPIGKMTKKECLQWIASCEAINALDDRNRVACKGNIDSYYSSEFTTRLYIYELYVMGYNPFFKEEEFNKWIQSLNLEKAESKRFSKLWQ